MFKKVSSRVIIPLSQPQLFTVKEHLSAFISGEPDDVVSSDVEAVVSRWTPVSNTPTPFPSGAPKSPSSAQRKIALHHWWCVSGNFMAVELEEFVDRKGREE